MKLPEEPKPIKSVSMAGEMRNFEDTLRSRGASNIFWVVVCEVGNHSAIGFLTNGEGRVLLVRKELRINFEGDAR
jgi:hypothetical protein